MTGLKLPRVSRGAVVALLAAPLALYAQSGGKAAFTIHDVLSAPFPSALVGAPAGDRFAWVFNAEGSRNVWVAERAADGAGYRSRALTRYTGDDGQDVGQVRFTPAGDAVVYVRGGDLEYLGAPEPNPTDLADPPAQTIWIVPVGGGSPRKIGDGHSPAVSPRGDRVAYISKGQIWLASVDGHAPPHEAVKARGGCSGLRWSPRGDALAFVSNRGDHSFIGVYAVGDHSVRYVDPSTDLDAEAVWSPDGSEIAFLRLPWSLDNWDRGPHRAGPPWSLRIATVATGRGRELWKAQAGTGSVFHAVAAENQLLWGAGDRIVFPAETDGWSHLYSIPSHGGAVVGLSPGAFEVETVSLSRDRTTLVYASNEGDIERRHVWKQRVDGSERVALTHGSGVEMTPVFGSDGRTVALIHSSATRPMRPAVVAGEDEPQDLAPSAIPAAFPSAALVAPEIVVVPSTDGVSVHGELFLPPSGSGATKHPALVFLHGGPVRQMLPAFHYMDYYNNAYAMNQYLASRGYVVLSLNYRLGIGYGMEFREPKNGVESGASEFDDVLAAGHYLQQRPDVDPARVGLWGGSYGGFLTAMGLARASDLFAAGVDFHGVHEWPHYDFTQNGSAAEYLPDIDSEQRRTALVSSPISYVKTWRSPVLFIHGDDDRNVDFSETVRLVAALRKQGVEPEQLVFPDEIHDFLLHRNIISAYEATAEFLGRRLAAGTVRSAAVATPGSTAPDGPKTRPNP